MPASKGWRRRPATRGSPTTATAASSTCSAAPRWAASTRSSSTKSTPLKDEKGVKLDTDLSADDLKELVKLQGRLQEARRRRLPAGPEEAVDARHQRRVQLVERQQGDRVPPHRAHHRPEGHRRQRAGDGLRQHGRGQSGTGVAFTRDPNTGENVFYGDYLINAQGEDVVAGIRTPEPIAKLDSEMPKVYKQLMEIRADAREALQGNAGHRVHRAGRHVPVHAPDPQRQAHRHRRRADRRRDGEGRADRRNDRREARRSRQLNHLLQPQLDPKSEGQAGRPGDRRQPRRGVAARSSCRPKPRRHAEKHPERADHARAQGDQPGGRGRHAPGERAFSPAPAARRATPPSSPAAGASRASSAARR